MKIKTKIKKILQKNYGENSYLLIEILKNEIEIIDTDTLLSIKIPFLDLNFHSEIEGINFERNSNNYDKTLIEGIFDKFEKLDLSQLLIKKIKFYYDFGFYYENYAEFFYYESELVKTLKNPLKEFTFGKYKIETGEASDIFKLIFSEITGDKYFQDWECHETIKIKFVDEKNFEKVIQMALYFINRYSPDQKATVRKLDSYYDYLDIKESKKISNIGEVKYQEPLIFYAEGLKYGDNEISFLYFYKVLEYFFLINRNEEYENLISEYNKSSELDKTDKFINKVSRIHTTNEKDSLNKLLNNPRYHDKIQNLANFTYSKKIISQSSIDTFAKELYVFRNTIIHGKFGDKFKLTLPSIVNGLNTREWIRITKNLAEIIIDNFC
ncbi:MAG: hypothetical protein ACRC5T_02270 [Cetobacterium sp.]